jgi:zinc transport system substrate-binding protein
VKSARALILLGAALLNCTCSTQRTHSTRVAVSIFPLYDVARRIAGDRLAVDVMLPPGMFDHNFEPKPRDFARVADTRLVVLIGFGLDRWGRKLAESAPGAEILEVGPRVDPLMVAADEGHEDDDDQPGAYDPHFWLDPVRMQTAAGLLVEAYSRLDPEGAPGFRSRGAAVKKSLADLHSDIDKRTRAFPRKSIVTFHRSWTYYAKRYGLTVEAVFEPFPGQEPTPTYLRDVLRVVTERQVAALFSEPQLNRRAAEVVAQETGVPLFELDPLGGTAGIDSYEALLRHDTDVLEKALK